jgi:hypothetical protein
MEQQLEALVAGVPGTSVRDKIMRLEGEMRKMSPIELPPTHYFAQGLYGRSIFIPRGTLLTGHIHKTEHLNVVVYGSISIVTEFGSKVIDGPYVFTAPAGAKKVGYALSDTLWLTVHATEKLEIAEIEDELIAMDYSEVPWLSSR